MTHEGEGFNFISSTFDSSDFDTLRGMTDEVIDLYGYPCIYKKFVGPDMVNHPLYKDRLTSTNNVDRFMTEVETHVLIENKHFVPQLLAHGYALNVETPVNAFMKLSDDVSPEDLVTLLYPHEAARYTFQVNSATIWKRLCYNVVLSVYVKDDMERVEVEDPPALPTPPKKRRKRI